jgi:hypothetical protein
MTFYATVYVPSNYFLAEFLGANVLDEKPFIVTPYLMNGNARNYFLEHPDGDRLHIVRFLYTHILLPHLACAAARHVSWSCLPPLTQDCPWRLESGTSSRSAEPYLHKSLFDVP